MRRVRAIQEMNMTFDSDKLDYSENCQKIFGKSTKGLVSISGIQILENIMLLLILKSFTMASRETS